MRLSSAATSMRGSVHPTPVCRFIPLAAKRARDPLSKWSMLSTGFELSVAATKLLGGALLGIVAPVRLIRRILLGVSAANAALFLIQHSSNLMALYVGVLCWGMNGLLQGVAWGALVGALVAALPDPRERGTSYALLSGSQNVGAAAVALFLMRDSSSQPSVSAEATLSATEWSALRSSLLVPAAVCLIGAVLLPAAIAYAAPDANIAPKDITSSKVTQTSLLSLLATTAVDRRQLLIAASYFCLSIVRTGVAMWALQFVPDLSSGSVMTASIAWALAAMEAGGFVGGVAAGAASDAIFEGRRAPVMSLACAISSAALTCLAFAPASPILASAMASPAMLAGMFVVIGGGAFAAHVLAGLFARELAPAASREVAGGMVKAVAQLGSAVGAAPFGAFAAAFGWQRAVLFLAVLMAVATGLSGLLWNVQAEPAGGAATNQEKSK